eukprot:3753878-Prorocentrum_lima.AAC.1
MTYTIPAGVVFRHPINKRMVLSEHQPLSWKRKSQGSSRSVLYKFDIYVIPAGYLNSSALIQASQEASTSTIA